MSAARTGVSAGAVNSAPVIAATSILVVMTHLPLCQSQVRRQLAGILPLPYQKHRSWDRLCRDKVTAPGGRHSGLRDDPESEQPDARSAAPISKADTPGIRSAREDRRSGR